MIHVSNLSKSFSDQTVLDNLNLDIQKGEVIAHIIIAFSTNKRPPSFKDINDKNGDFVFCPRWRRTRYIVQILPYGE